MNRTRRVAATIIVAGALGFGGSVDAQRQEADGLINVQVGNITIEDAVDVNVAASVAAAICGVDIGPVAVLATVVDTTGRTAVVCTAEGGAVRLENNR